MRRDDVPAAHSMDTSWFAVDSQGHVGLFDTGEDGALPTRAANLGGPVEANFDDLVFRAAVLAKARGNTWEKHETDPPNVPTRLMVVKAPPALDPAVFEEISQGPPWVGLSRKPLRFSKLEGRADFITVLTADELYEAISLNRDEGDENSGLYRFHREHGDEPGRYSRFEAPATPLTVEAFPPSTREAIGVFKLPVDFASAQTVHLADHLADADAALYGNDWTLKSFGVQGVKSSQPRRAPLWPWMVVLIVILLSWLLLRPR